ncbi:MAG: DUF3365 domain-containing protein [Planctomycetaceae bacterium]|nr:DUF3365 domain-containing protein [Planctomycetaceae bacterium]
MAGIHCDSNSTESSRLLMWFRHAIGTHVSVIAIFLSTNSGLLAGEEQPAASATSPTAASTGTAEAADMVDELALQHARREAKGLHSTIHATLHLVHDQFYREDEALPIPAAMMRDVFDKVESEHPVKLRWLVVEGLAMNTDHEARTDFEKAAVKALRSGEESHEMIDDGRLIRAAPIRLANECLKCHVPDRRSTRDRVAGLIVSIPLDSSALLPAK